MVSAIRCWMKVQGGSTPFLSMASMSCKHTWRSSPFADALGLADTVDGWDVSVASLKMCSLFSCKYTTAYYTKVLCH